MSYITMWSYLWDLVDEGIEDVLKMLRDEVGLTGISVATSYHSVEHLRPHGVRPTLFRSEGALYFQPQRSLFITTKIEPRPSPWLVGHNPLKTISSRCESLGMHLISWTVCCHSSYLGSRYPECTLHDAFGNPYPPGLCPANESVRSYLKAVVRDLVSHYKMFAIEVESLCYDTWRHTHHHEKIGVPLGAVEKFLMGLCFCKSCRNRAEARGIEMEHLQTAVQEILLQSWSEGKVHGGTAADLVESLPGLKDYLRMRIDVVTTLTQEIKSICEPAGSLLICMDMGDPALSGFDMKIIAGIADRIELLCYTDSVGQIEASVQQAVEQGVPVERITMGLCAYPPASPDAESLQRVTGKAAAMGVKSFSFYNYGIMPRKNLMWVRKAIRGIA